MHVKNYFSPAVFIGVKNRIFTVFKIELNAMTKIIKIALKLMSLKQLFKKQVLTTHIQTCFKHIPHTYNNCLKILRIFH